MIKVRYQACDGFKQTRKYKTLKGAQRYAQERIGEFPEMGSDYAVSGDGIGTIRVEGACLYELFPAFQADQEAQGVRPGCAFGPFMSPPAKRSTPERPPWLDS